MADISSFLQKILSAIYGEEVRGSIHDALAAMNKESSSAMEFASTAKDSAQASAEAAKQSADDAGKKAENASASASAAALSEGIIKAAEENATKQAADAKKAAEGAKESETAAKNSEDVAVLKAQEATDAKEAAALSESEAKAAEERVRTIRSDAEKFSTQTAADRKAAEEARLGAETARDAAANSQNGAKASEDAAKAAEANAESAKLVATDARDKAVDAKTVVEKARDAAALSEGNAKIYKESAAESAATAQQYSGKPPKPENGTWWIWDAEKAAYVNTGIKCELVGPTGNGIASIQLTKGDHSPGSTDIYTVLMTDGTKTTISVYNGLNGTGAGDVLGIHFDLVLPSSGWESGSITVAESRLVAAAKYKYLVDAYEASREEYLECNVRPKDISTTGFLTFVCDTDPMADITVNIVRLELSVNIEEGGA
jgi:hypothetical protein